MIFFLVEKGSFSFLTSKQIIPFMWVSILKWLWRADILRFFGRGLHSLNNAESRVVLSSGKSHYRERSFWAIYSKFWLKQSEKYQNWSLCPWISTRLIYKGNLHFMKSLGFIVFPKATPSGETLDHDKQRRATVVNLVWKHPIKHTVSFMFLDIYY